MAKKTSMKLIPYKSFKKRSTEPEIMDGNEFTGKNLVQTLKDIDKINKKLGGNRIIISGLQQLLKNQLKDKVITIADIGCGSGQILKKIAKWGRKEGYTFKLIGIDNNIETIKFAEKNSKNYPEISFLNKDIFNSSYNPLYFDVIGSVI